MKKTIGEIIKDARKEANLTQKELADKIYINQQAISKWESEKSRPNLESCMLIAKVLKIDLNDLIGAKTMNMNTYFNALDTIKKIEDISGNILNEISIETKYGYEVNLLCKWSLILVIGNLWQFNYRTVDELLEWWDVSDQLKYFLLGDIDINNWCTDIVDFISLASNDDDYNDYHDSLKAMMNNMNDDDRQSLAALYDLENFDLLKYCEDVVKYADALKRSIVKTSDVYAKMRVALNEIILCLDSDRPDDYVSSF